MFSVHSGFLSPDPGTSACALALIGDLAQPGQALLEGGPMFRRHLLGNGLLDRGEKIGPGHQGEADHRLLHSLSRPRPLKGFKRLLGRVNLGRSLYIPSLCLTWATACFTCGTIWAALSR